MIILLFSGVIAKIMNYGIKKFKLLFDLYFTFMKIGGFTLGSGYAMIPLIENEAVNKKRWVSKEEFADYIALSQSVPGVIAINTATSIGKKVAGIPGAIISTLGMVTLPFFIIIVIAMFFSKFRESPFILDAFNGIQVATIVMITLSFLSLYRSGVKNKFQFLIFLLAFIALIFFSISPVYIILSSGAMALLYKKFYS